MAAVWAQHRETMLARVDTLERAATELDSGAVPPALNEEAIQAAHQLAGTAGGFGFSRTSELARDVETTLRDAAVTSDAVPELASAIAEMQADLSRPTFTATVERTAAPPPPPGAAASVASLPLVLLVMSDGERAERIRTEAVRRGLRVDATARLDDVPVRMHREEPQVVVLDTACEGDPLGLLGNLRIPVLVAAAADTLELRQEAAQLGAAALVAPEATPGAIADEVVLLLQRQTPAASRVLLAGVGDDELRAGLLEAGLDVVAGGDDIVADLRSSRPDAIVLEDPDLCRAVRTDTRWSVAPILLLSADLTLDEAFAAGADDLAATPEEAIVRLRGRLGRFRAHAALTESDAPTGLANRRASTTAIGAQLRMAERLGKPVCLTMLDVADDATLRAAGAALRHGLRDEDVVARWGERHLIVSMFGIERQGSIDRIGRLLSKAGMNGYRGGVAEFPGDGANLEGLYAAAAQAAFDADDDKLGGAGRGPGSAQQVDVAIIEDDEATSEMISRLLTERGHRCWRFSNGAGAVAMLAGASPRVRASVVLLDLNLPAVDGMELLTLISREGLLRTTRVMVYSASDNQVLKDRARELGAVDYIVKPAPFEQIAVRIDELLGRRR